MQILFQIIIFSFLAGQQPGQYRLAGSVKTSADFWHTDQMGNIYLATGNSIVKFDAHLSRSAEYSSPRLGNVFSMDVTDPLRILVYYKDHNQVVWLDNYLNEIRSPLLLDELSIDQAEQVCSSSQGGFWVYNGLNAQLEYYDARLQPVHQSMDLNALAGPDLNPAYLIEKNQQLYMGVPGTGVLVFDRFGNYSRTLSQDMPACFQVIDNYLYYFTGGEFFRVDLLTGNILPVEVPGIKGIIHVEVQPGLLFIYSGEVLQVYSTIP